MELRILAVGDVVGDTGLDFLRQHLPALRKLHDVHFTVVNGENAACNGLLPRQAEDIFSAGADVITMGNHTWDKQQIVNYMDDTPYIIRPANYTAKAPGRGWGIFDGPGACASGWSTSSAGVRWIPTLTTPSPKRMRFWVRARRT